MEFMTPSESVIHDKLLHLDNKAKDRLISAVNKVAVARDFFYKKRDNHPVGLVPLVLGRRLLPVFRGLTRSIFNFQMKAPRLFRENYRSFADLIRLERRTKAWLERTGGKNHRPWELLARPDYSMRLVDGQLSPILFELNSLMLGGMQIQAVALEIMKTCVLPKLGLEPKRLGIEPTIDMLAFHARWLSDCRRKAGAAGGGGVAFLEQLPPGGGFSELPRITEYCRKAGIRGEHGDPRELKLKDGRVTLHGMPVAFVYRDFSYEDVGGPDNPKLKPFLKLWEEGRVTPGFPADFDQKGILECFTSEEFDGLFTRDEVRRWRAHVPWTRVLTGRKTKTAAGKRVDLPEYALRERENLVIKPSWSSGGDGILIGRKVKPARWAKALGKAVKSPGAFAVQAYVDAPPRPTGYLRDGKIQLKTCRYTVGMFHDGANFGYHLRVSPKDIVNVAQGGALAPVYLD